MNNYFFCILPHKDVTYATSFKELGNGQEATVGIKFSKLGDARPELGGFSHETELFLCNKSLIFNISKSYESI